MTEFLLIRHAVNDFVKTGKLAGWTPDVHLNEDGRAQAEALGVRLAKAKINAIYSSPLERTVETAQAVLVHHPHLTLQLLDDVGEVRYGTWQGEELSKLSQRKAWRVVQGVPSRMRFPNGEAMRDTQLRAVNALENLVEKHPRATVAVVSHSDVIKMIVTHYLGLHLDMFQRIEISPASLTVISMSHGRPTIVQVNETSYLPLPKPKDEDGKKTVIDLVQSVRSITVDTIGVPGSRVFYLQAEDDTGNVHSLLMEKTQAVILADQIDDLLVDLSGRYPTLLPGAAVETVPLVSPEKVMFRAGQFALQYDAEADLIGLEVSELRGNDQGSPSVLRLRMTRQQMRALADQARRAARGGLASPGE